MCGTSFCLSFNRALQADEGGGPVPLILSHPAFVNPLNGDRIEEVDATPAFGNNRDQLRLPQKRQMLHGHEAVFAQRFRQFPSGSRRVAQQIQYTPPMWIRECPPDLIQIFM